MYQIESNVPVPDCRKNKGVYPWKQMKVGDSFFVERLGQVEKRKLVVSLNGSGRRNFPIRCQVQPNGVRCWRIA